jgi:hypothetical protein
MREFGIGLTFRPATPDALAAAVRTLHEHSEPDELLQQIRLAKRKYSWSAAARATLLGYRAASAMEEAVQQGDDECAIETTSAF